MPLALRLIAPNPRRLFALAAVPWLALASCGDAEREAPQAGPAPAPEESAAAPEPPPPAAAQPLEAEQPRTAWVGSAECAGCHAEVSERWRGSHHDLAMQEATAEAVLADFEGATFTDGPTTWTFTRRDGRHLARAEGAERGEFEIAYTFGVDPLQQYLVQMPDGRLQALHVAWDSRPAAAGGQRWFSLYGDDAVPVGDPIHWQGPALTWNSMCGDCHSTGFRKGFDLAANRYASGWAEIDVACEACHGSGARHVAWARGSAGDATGAGGRGLSVALAPPTEWVFSEGEPIARPAGGAAGHTGELDTCSPCHARRARITEAPPPGSPFLDAYQPALLERGLYHDDGQIEDEVYEFGSFVQSRMHDAGVRCSDCHDPHSATLRAEGNALCGGCHAPARFDTPEHHHHPRDSAGASCVSCHMPARTYMTVDTRRDHSFRVPRPDLSRALGTPNACADCHAERGDAWSASAVAKWRGGAPAAAHFGERLHARQSGGTSAGAELASLFEDPTEPAIARATALVELSSVPPALALIREAASADDALLRFAAARSSSGLPAADRVRAVAALLDDPLRGVRIEAAFSLADTGSALSASQRAALASGLDEYRAAQRVSADTPVGHVNLALLHERLGEEKAAEDAYRTALRIGDYFLPAYTQLAELLGRQARDGEAAELLHRGIERLPEAADLHFSLGLLLARREQLEPANQEFATALRLAPEVGYFAFVYGVGLHSAGRTDDALRVLGDAARHNPSDQNVLGAIATIARDAGRYDEAIEAAERLRELFPGQPETQLLLDDIRARSGAAPTPDAAPSLPATTP